MPNWREMFFEGVPEPERGEEGKGKKVVKEVGKGVLQSLLSGAPEEDYLIREEIRKKHRLAEVAEDEERRQVKRRERKKKRQERREKGMEIARVVVGGVLGLATGGVKGVAKAILTSRKRKALSSSEGGGGGKVVIEGRFKEED